MKRFPPLRIFFNRSSLRVLIFLTIFRQFVFKFYPFFAKMKMGVFVQKMAENPCFIRASSLCLSEATTRFELVIRVLQTHALPLGYVAIPLYK